MKVALAAVTLLAAALIVAWWLTAGRDDPAPTRVGGALAHLWVDQDGGTCEREDPPAGYSDATACPPFTTRSEADQGAILNAEAGDLILVRDQPGGDDYGKLVLGPHDKEVTIRAARPGIEWSESIVACNRCTIEGMTFENRAPHPDADDDWACQGPAPDGRGATDFFTNGVLSVCSAITLRDFEIDGRHVTVRGACPNVGLAGNLTGALIQNGRIHGVWDAKGIDFGGTGATLDGIVFEDIGRPGTCDPDVHNECIYSGGGYHGLTLRNSQFRGCPSGQGVALLGNCAGGDGPGDVLLENNVFARTNEGSGKDPRNDWHPAGGGRSLFIGGSACDIDATWTVRYNTFETAPDADGGDTLADGPGSGRWYGNLGAADCSTRWAYHHNVGQTCGGSDSVPASPFANTAADPKAMASWYADASDWDFHLVKGAAAIGAGDPAHAPETDLDGVKRGDPPDAGAYEYVAR